MEHVTKYIRRIWRCTVLHRESALSGGGLSGCQHSYIFKICRHPGATQEQLARMLFVNKSNVARQLSLLEAGGFITRAPDERDRRALRVFPTEKALAVYPRVRAETDEWNAYLTETLTREEQAQLAALLARVAGRASAAVGGESEMELGKETEVEAPCAPSLDI